MKIKLIALALLLGFGGSSSDIFAGKRRRDRSKKKTDKNMKKGRKPSSKSKNNDSDSFLDKIIKENNKIKSNESYVHCNEILNNCHPKFKLTYLKKLKLFVDCFSNKQISFFNEMIRKLETTIKLNNNYNLILNNEYVYKVEKIKTKDNNKRLNVILKPVCDRESSFIAAKYKWIKSKSLNYNFTNEDWQFLEKYSRSGNTVASLILAIHKQRILSKKYKKEVKELKLLVNKITRIHYKLGVNEQGKNYSYKYGFVAIFYFFLEKETEFKIKYKLKVDSLLLERNADLRQLIQNFKDRSERNYNRQKKLIELFVKEIKRVEDKKTLTKKIESKTIPFTKKIIKKNRTLYFNHSNFIDKYSNEEPSFEYPEEQNSEKKFCKFDNKIFFKARQSKPPFTVFYKRVYRWWWKYSLNKIWEAFTKYEEIIYGKIWKNSKIRNRIIADHTVPHIVDRFIGALAIKCKRVGKYAREGDYSYNIPAEITDNSDGTTTMGVISYGVDKYGKCLHRCFSLKPLKNLIEEFNKRIMDCDLSEELNFCEDGPNNLFSSNYLQVENDAKVVETDMFVIIEDIRNNRTIRLFKIKREEEEIFDPYNLGIVT